ncbi:MAG: hypothetical protein OES18_08360, partial [Deltaproteobacteria bacterium]|nr:hypothetical protein [Deltaproteobacteria bacterium]
AIRPGTLFITFPSFFSVSLPTMRPLSFLDPFLQLALCLTRTEYQNRFCITDTRSYRIIVDVEMPRKLFLAAVICRDLL